MMLWEWITSLGGNPVLLLLLLAAPFVLVAARKQIYPYWPLLGACAVPVLVTFLLLVKQDVLPLILALDVAVAIFAGVDAASLPRRNQFSVERTCQRVASLRQKHRVALTVTNRAKHGVQVTLRDGVPPEFDVQPSEFSLVLPAHSRTTVHYDLRASRRGQFTLQQAHLRVRSRLGLWQRLMSCSVESVLHVYPDMKQLTEYAVLARTNRLSLMGVRRTRRVGTDNEFERLRDYTLDDNYKHIDWRSTARRGKLTVKDHQTSQSQRVIFLVDCGRMMTNTSGGISLLDHALNAMLMLGYVAVSRGDSVGLLTFSDRIHSFVPPQGGRSQMNRLLHASFDQFARLVESRYADAFLYLNSHCRKRSLVILITNLIDQVNAGQVQQYLSVLSGRHLPMGVLLRDHQLFDRLESTDLPQGRLYEMAAAAEILNWRHQILTDLQHRGVLALDVFAEDMTAPLINQYLDIKARNLL